MSEKTAAGCGVLLVGLGVIMAVGLRAPHFYAPFSVGLMLIGWSLLRGWTDVRLFAGWRWYHWSAFAAGLLVIAFVADHIGISQHLWAYPHYHSVLDWLVQKTCEFAVAMTYLFFFLRFGVARWHKRLPSAAAWPLAAVSFVLPLAVLTQILNSFADSWVVLHMPITDARVGSVSVVFTSLGYWILAGLPQLLHQMITALPHQPSGRPLRPA